MVNLRLVYLQDTLIAKSTSVVEINRSNFVRPTKAITRTCSSPLDHIRTILCEEKKDSNLCE
jgi:hypothetical protein